MSETEAGLVGASLESWGEAIKAFARDHKARRSAQSLDVLERRLTRASRELGRTPWTVSTEQLRGWLSGLSAAPMTVKAYRHALRVFYRWAVTSGRIASDPMPGHAPVTRYRLEAKWQDALDMFEHAQGEEGIAASTISNRLKHLQRFAADADCSPWQVTNEQIVGWLEQGLLSNHTMASMRSTLRAFYRWAVRAGRIAADPTPAPAGLKRLGVPEPWDEPIRAWKLSLRMTGLQETTIRIRDEQLSQFARDHVSLNPFDVTFEDLIEWLAGKKWSPERRRNFRQGLRAFYGWAVDTGRMDVSPAEKLPVVKAARPNPRPASEADYKTALAFADAREHLALRCAAELGMRRGEVAVIHSRDVIEDEDGQSQLMVHGKGGKTRILPLTFSLATALRSRGEGYMFPGLMDGHISPRRLGELITDVLPDGVTMHQLRHRFATRAYAVDRDVFTVQQLLGHSSPATTQRYVRIPEHAKRRLVELVAEDDPNSSGRSPSSVGGA